MLHCQLLLYYVSTHYVCVGWHFHSKQQILNLKISISKPQCHFAGLLQWQGGSPPTDFGIDTLRHFCVMDTLKICVKLCFTKITQVRFNRSRHKMTRYVRNSETCMLFPNFMIVHFVQFELDLKTKFRPIGLTRGRRMLRKIKLIEDSIFK